MLTEIVYDMIQSVMSSLVSKFGRNTVSILVVFFWTEQFGFLYNIF